MSVYQLPSAVKEREDRIRAMLDGVCPGERKNYPQAFDGLVGHMACSETKFATVKVCTAYTLFSKRVYTCLGLGWFVSSRLFAHHYTFPTLQLQLMAAAGGLDVTFRVVPLIRSLSCDPVAMGLDPVTFLPVGCPSFGSLYPKLPSSVASSASPNTPSIATVVIVSGWTPYDRVLTAIESAKSLSGQVPKLCMTTAADTAHSGAPLHVTLIMDDITPTAHVAKSWTSTLPAGWDLTCRPVPVDILTVKNRQAVAERTMQAVSAALRSGTDILLVASGLASTSGGRSKLLASLSASHRRCTTSSSKQSFAVLPVPGDESPARVPLSLIDTAGLQAKHVKDPSVRVDV